MSKFSNFKQKVENMVGNDTDAKTSTQTGSQFIKNTVAGVQFSEKDFDTVTTKSAKTLDDFFNDEIPFEQSSRDKSIPVVKEFPVNQEIPNKTPVRDELAERVRSVHEKVDDLLKPVTKNGEVDEVDVVPAPMTEDTKVEDVVVEKVTEMKPPAVSGQYKDTSMYDQTKRAMVLNLRKPIKLEEYNGNFDRIEIATSIIKELFSTYRISSINQDVFGGLLKDVIVPGFQTITLDEHTFIVRDAEDDLTRILLLLERLRQELKESRIMRCRLVKAVDLDGITGYELSITLSELEKVSAVYPNYIFEIENVDAPVKDLMLVIRS